MTMKKDYEYEFLTDDFNIDDIEIATKEGRWSSTLIEWGNTDSKKMRFTLHNAKEKNACANAIRAYVRTHKLDWTVFCEQNKFNVYVVRS